MLAGDTVGPQWAKGADLKKAEIFSDEGNAKWEELIEECRELFFEQFLPELDEN